MAIGNEDGSASYKLARLGSLIQNGDNMLCCNGFEGCGVTCHAIASGMTWRYKIEGDSGRAIVVSQGIGSCPSRIAGFERYRQELRANLKVGLNIRTT